MSKVISLLLTFLLYPASAQPSDVIYYFSELGTDGVLGKRSAGCFFSPVFRANQCINGVRIVNSFAVEYNGMLFCADGPTPVREKPLLRYSGRASSGSRCTLRGWVH